MTNQWITYRAKGEEGGPYKGCDVYPVFGSFAGYLAYNRNDRKASTTFLFREDYMVEAMEILEMYCDLLLAR